MKITIETPLLKYGKTLLNKEIQIEILNTFTQEKLVTSYDITLTTRFNLAYTRRKVSLFRKFRSDS